MNDQYRGAFSVDAMALGEKNINRRFRKEKFTPTPKTHAMMH
jgi:hypothetical protein